MKNFYDVLGIDARCTAEEIREAYRKLSKKFHPDLNGGDTYFENRLKEVCEAYETLGDAGRRTKYDASLKQNTVAPIGLIAPKKRFAVNKAIDIAFTLMLGLITALFGSYVYKAMYGSKTAKVVKAPLVNTAVVTNAHSHHKKRSLNSKIASLKPIVNNDETHVSSVAAIRQTINLKPPPQIENPKKTNLPLAVSKVDTASIRPAKSAPVVIQPAPVKRSYPKPVDNNFGNTPNATSSAYIRANATGVVYLRQADNYSSAIVGEIPAHSQVQVLEKGATFSKITFNNKTGYVPNWTVVQ